MFAIVERGHLAEPGELRLRQPAQLADLLQVVGQVASEGREGVVVHGRRIPPGRLEDKRVDAPSRPAAGRSVAAPRWDPTDHLSQRGPFTPTPPAEAPPTAAFVAGKPPSIRVEWALRAAGDPLTRPNPEWRRRSSRPAAERARDRPHSRGRTRHGPTPAPADRCARARAPARGRPGRRRGGRLRPPGPLPQELRRHRAHDLASALPRDPRASAGIRASASTSGSAGARASGSPSRSRSSGSRTRTGSGSGAGSAASTASSSSSKTGSSPTSSWAPAHWGSGRRACRVRASTGDSEPASDSTST